MVTQTHPRSTTREIAAETYGMRPPVFAFLASALVCGCVTAALSLVVLDTQQIGYTNAAVGLLFYIVAITVAAIGLVKSFPHARLGYCNVVTLLRLAMVAVLVIAHVSGAPQSWTLVGFAVIALSLDGVDGWLARRQELTSSFGARFDMEVDAAFAMVLALMAFSNGVVGVFVLLLGLPSYLFFVAKYALPWLDAPLPDLFSRKLVCVIQISVLIALQLPLHFGGLLNPLALGAVAALIWSFGRDIRWLARARS